MLKQRISANNNTFDYSKITEEDAAELVSGGGGGAMGKKKGARREIKKGKRSGGEKIEAIAENFIEAIQSCESAEDLQVLYDEHAFVTKVIKNQGNNISLQFPVAFKGCFGKLVHEQTLSTFSASMRGRRYGIRAGDYLLVQDGFISATFDAADVKIIKGIYEGIEVELPGGFFPMDEEKVHEGFVFDRSLAAAAAEASDEDDKSDSEDSDEDSDEDEKGGKKAKKAKKAKKSSKKGGHRTSNGRSHKGGGGGD
jgi:hypothetical protein